MSLNIKQIKIYSWNWISKKTKSVHFIRAVKVISKKLHNKFLFKKLGDKLIVDNSLSSLLISKKSFYILYQINHLRLVGSFVKIIGQSQIDQKIFSIVQVQSRKIRREKEKKRDKKEKKSFFTKFKDVDYRMDEKTSKCLFIIFILEMLFLAYLVELLAG